MAERGEPFEPDDDPDDLAGWYEPDVLAVLDSWVPAGDAGSEPFSTRLTRWSRSAAMGMVLSGVAMGLAEVLEPLDQEQIVVEVDGTGEPEHLPVRLFLDPDSPAGSLCIVRRDLLPTPEV